MHTSMSINIDHSGGEGAARGAPPPPERGARLGARVVLGSADAALAVEASHGGRPEVARKAEVGDPQHNVDLTAHVHTRTGVKVNEINQIETVGLKPVGVQCTW